MADWYVACGVAWLHLRKQDNAYVILQPRIHCIVPFASVDVTILCVNPPVPQLSKAILTLLSMFAVLFQREEAETFLDVWLFVLRCSTLLRCCCIAVAGSPGGVVFGFIANRIVAICGSRHATAWSSAWVRHVGAGGQWSEVAQF